VSKKSASKKGAAGAAWPREGDSLHVINLVMARGGGGKATQEMGGIVRLSANTDHDVYISGAVWEEGTNRKKGETRDVD